MLTSKSTAFSEINVSPLTRKVTKYYLNKRQPSVPDSFLVGAFHSVAWLAFFLLLESPRALTHSLPRRSPRSCLPISLVNEPPAVQS